MELACLAAHGRSGADGATWAQSRRNLGAISEATWALLAPALEVLPHLLLAEDGAILRHACHARVTHRPRTGQGRASRRL